MVSPEPATGQEEVRAIIAPYLTLEGPLLPVLHAVQAHYGHIPEAAQAVVTDALNISRAELHGVISFYHDFRTAPAGRCIVRICRAEACQAMGAGELAAAALDRHGLDWHGTTADGAVTVEPVYCLGLCACAPAVMAGSRLHGRVDAAKLDAILTEGAA